MFITNAMRCNSELQTPYFIFIDIATRLAPTGQIHITIVLLARDAVISALVLLLLQPAVVVAVVSEDYLKQKMILINNIHGDTQQERGITMHTVHTTGS